MSSTRSAPDIAYDGEAMRPGLLAAVWAGTAANRPSVRGPPPRDVPAGHSASRRAVPEGGTLEAKSGGLFRRVFNEVALITDASGESYSVAVLIRAHRPYTSRAAIGGAMSLAVAEALEHLRIPSQ